MKNWIINKALSSLPDIYEKLKIATVKKWLYKVKYPIGTQWSECSGVLRTKNDINYSLNVSNPVFFAVYWLYFIFKSR